MGEGWQSNNADNDNLKENRYISIYMKWKKKHNHRFMQNKDFIVQFVHFKKQIVSMLNVAALQLTSVCVSKWCILVSGYMPYKLEASKWCWGCERGILTVSPSLECSPRSLLFLHPVLPWQKHSCWWLLGFCLRLRLIFKLSASVEFYLNVQNQPLNENVGYGALISQCEAPISIGYQEISGFFNYC